MTVEAALLDANGYAAPPEFFGRRPQPPLRADSVVFQKNKPKVGGRRKRSPDPRTFGYELVTLLEDGGLLLEFDPDIRDDMAMLARRVPDDIRLSPDLEPDYVGAAGGRALYSASSISSDIKVPPDMLDFEGPVQVRLDANADPPQFTPNRSHNMRSSEDGSRYLNDPAHRDDFVRPYNDMWHEALGPDCWARLILADRFLHRNVPHTGGVAKVEAGLCGGGS